MNIENLASYLSNKEQFTEKSVSEIMHLLEKYPYFQIAHMLLLKGVQNVQPEKYNKQLKISGSFISDKSKLFQFINSSTPTDKETKQEEIIEKKEDSSNRNSLKRFTRKEKPLRTDTKKESQVSSISKKLPTKEEEVLEAENKTEKKTNGEKQVKKETIKKKVDLPEEVIEKQADENSKQKHHEIVKDFFHTSEKPKEKTRVAETIKKEEKSPLKKELIEKESQPHIKKVETKKEVSENEKQPHIKKVETKKEVSENEKQPHIKKVETKKEVSENEKQPHIKKVETKKELVNKEEITPKKEAEKETRISELTVKKTIKEVPVSEIKAPEKKETVITNKTTSEPEKKSAQDIINKRKETETSPKKEVSESDAMNNIFSKIRQIKKEMNIDSGSTPKTIDVNKGDDSSTVKKPTEKKTPTRRVIKESFIGFDETPSTEKKEITTSKEESKKTDIVEETEQIKESELTAKDLFKKHKLKKEQSAYLKTDQTHVEDGEKKSASPISKLVDIVNDNSIKTNEPEKKDSKLEEKRITDDKKETGSVINAGELSAAEKLLQKIAAKKKNIEIERQEEERKKLEGKNKEANAINELVKHGSEKKEETTTEIKKEEAIEKSKTEQKTEELNQKTIEKPVKKAQNLIDNFIEKVDTLERIGSKESKLSGDISEESTIESEEIMTETFADLLIQQKNYQKAIEVYNKLILKFPEKKTYFAIQIKKVESLIK